MQDQHTLQLGRLVASYHSLEFVLRAFLTKRAFPDDDGPNHGIDPYQLEVGATIAEDPLSNYEALAQLMTKANEHLTEMGELALPAD